MADSMEFFKKWTPIMPGAQLNSEPFDVTPYKSVSIKAYCAGFVAPGPLALQVEGSPDLGYWDPIGVPLNLGAGNTWASDVVNNPPRFLRVVATTAGGMMTFFATGLGREN